jgi:hypothetical protein
MIIFLIVLLILVIYYLSYFIYSNRNILNINRLLKDRQIVPIASKPALLDKPLNEFYINTSHNSYLSFLQHLSFVKSQNIKNVLEFGARVIELDISHMNNIPIVAHGTKNFITTSYIYLEKALDTILQYGFKTSDPLIIFCEIYNPENQIVIQNIKQIFLNKFKDKLLLPNTTDIGNNIANKPIKFFLNKVILLGPLDNFNILQDLIFPDYNYINYSDDDDRLSQLYNGLELTRVYKASGIFSYLSFNFDFLSLWKNNYKLVTMNFQMKDSILYNYLKFFKNTSFIHQSEIDI